MSTTTPRTATSATSTTDRADLLRSVALLIAMTAQFAAGIVGGIGLGAEQVGTVANSYPNPLLPAGTAFSIWTLIYLVTLATAIRHCLPSQRGRAVQRAIGWKLTLAGVLNTSWVLVFSNRGILFAQLIIVALLVVLAWTYRAAIAHPASGTADRLTVHIPIAIYTGWVSAATVVGLVTTLTANDVAVTDAAALLLLAAAAVGFAAATWFADAKAGYALTLTWALLWVAAAATTPIAVTAVSSAVLVLAVAAASTWRRRDRATALLG